MVVRPLKGHGSFEEVLRTGVRVTSGPLAMTIVFADSAVQTTILCGVSAPKRVVRKAVLRNRIKRLLREAVHKTVLAQEQRCYAVGVAVIVAIWRSAPERHTLHLRDVLPRVQSGLEKALKNAAPMSAKASP